MTALYEIAASYRADLAKLEDMEIDEATLSDTLESLGGELEAKAISVASFVRNIEATAAAIREAEAAMAARRRALENRAARVKDYLLANMMVTGVQKIECPLFRLAVRENPPAVEIYEPGLIPAQYMRQPEPPPPVVDKKALAEVLKRGEDVPGAKLTRGVRLEIR